VISTPSNIEAVNFSLVLTLAEPQLKFAFATAEITDVMFTMAILLQLLNDQVEGVFGPLFHLQAIPFVVLRLLAIYKTYIIEKLGVFEKRDCFLTY
jgi:hypothetical protein